ncbi:MAG: Unknown protein [uncultured Sulfurovum sp.]|uniref:7(1) septoil knot domain-containing protein n=1 Tax=uncultured Sulfurovum sp. TaxID=269237 RepID=A0A6S6SDL1_9BACT|nr:MAG: Unknown protein [uncultured Sulfurovum sp.]
MKKSLKSLSILILFTGGTLSANSSTPCTKNGITLYGKVQFVDSFPDLKIEYVDSFPDIDVEFVSSFPSTCGKWKIVDSFPDFKVQIVTSFPDLKVRKFTAFAGMK